MPAKTDTLITVLLLTTVIWTSATAAESQPLSLLPVWSMTVENEHAIVLHNDLRRHGLSFPLSSVRVYERRRLPVDGNDRAGIAVSYVAIVPISRGGIPVTDPHYVPYRAVGRGPSGSAPPVIIGAENTDPLSGSISLFDPLGEAHVNLSDYRQWFASEMERSGVLFAADRTIVFDRGEVTLTIPRPGYEAAFSRDGGVGAACVLELPVGKAKPDPRGEPGSLIVFDMNGSVLREVSFEPGNGLSQLYVSGNGSWVMATERGNEASIASDRVMWIDVASGTKQYLTGVAGGYRHHSGDDRYMAEVQGGWGKIIYFSMSDPSHPAKISEYRDSENGIVSASINHDGGLVAAMLSSRIARAASRVEQRVVVLDRGMQVVAIAERKRGNGFGVTIVDEFLFVGLQTCEQPHLGSVSSSDRIDLYDIGDVK